MHRISQFHLLSIVNPGATPTSLIIISSFIMLVLLLLQDQVDIHLKLLHVNQALVNSAQVQDVLLALILHHLLPLATPLQIGRDIGT